MDTDLGRGGIGFWVVSLNWNLSGWGTVKFEMGVEFVVWDEVNLYIRVEVRGYLRVRLELSL